MADDSALLGELAEEFSARVRQGQMPEIEDYARKHPNLSERIRALFPTLMLLEGMAAGKPPTDGPAVSGGELAPGITFGNFRIEKEVGRGGMGVVYEATHLALNKRVALKVLPIQGPRQAGQLERFLREAQTAAALHHTNIVPVFDVGQVNGVPYYAMQYIEGRGLDRVLRELEPREAKPPPAPAVQPPTVIEARPAPRTSATQAQTLAPRVPLPALEPAAVASGPSLEETSRAASVAASARREHGNFFHWVAEIGIQSAEGLAHAHQRGVIHRDIKPSNLILDERGVVWITDFGLARRSEDPVLTKSGVMLGTPRYMSPEQAEAARKNIDHRTDIYSLGATLYELLTRRPAFDGPTPLDIVLKIIERSPAPPRQLNPAVPRDLETIVLKAMAKRPEDRYQTAAELADDLRRYLKLEPIKARRIGLVGRTIRWSRRNPRLAAVTGTAAAIVLVLSAIYYWSLVNENARTLQALAGEQVALRKTTAALAEAKKNREDAEKQRDRARDAQENAQDHLCRSLYEQARAVRISGRTGRRWKTLDLLKEAEKLRSRLRPVAAHPSGSPALPTQAELRTEAVAALLLRDAQCILEVTEQMGMPPSLTADGRLAAVPWLDFNVKKESQKDIKPKSGVRLLDLDTGREIAKWQDSEMLLTSVLSPDGKWLAWGGEKIHLWHVAEGKPAGVLPIPEAEKSKETLGVLWLAFSPDGRHLGGIQLHDDRVDIILWDLKTKKPRILAQVKNPDMNVLAFSPSGKLLAYSSGEKKITLWNLEMQAQAAELECPDTPAAMAFSRDGQLLAAPCGSSKEGKWMVVLWDLAKNTERARWAIEGSQLAGGLVPPSLAFHPTQKLLALSQHMGNIHFRDPFTGKEIFRLESAHKLWVMKLAWRPDGKQLTSAASDGSIKVWRLSGDQFRSTIHAGGTTFLPLARSRFLFSPDGKWLVVEGKKSIQLLHRATGKVEHEWPLRGQLLFRPDSRKLAVFGNDDFKKSKAVVFDLSTGKQEARRDVADTLHSAAFAGNGQLLVTLQQNKRPVVWNVHTNQQVWQAPTDTITHGGSLSPDASLLLGYRDTLPVPGVKTSVILWELATGRKLAEFALADRTFSPQDPAFSPDGRWVTLSAFSLSGRGEKKAGPGSGLTVLSVPNLQKRFGIPADPFPGPHAFSPDSRLLAVANIDGSIALWDVEHGRELFRYSDSTQPVDNVAFTPEGDLATNPTPSPDLQVLHAHRLRKQLAEIGLGW
jgi:serine/threonine protein kinase/WD40 repeat protein